MKNNKYPNLRIIGMFCNMILKSGLWDISPPPGHKFNVFEVTLFAFEFKIGIDRNIKNIKKPCGM
jgi:hypothetical protein